ncbi:MFS transporter [Nonomuraea sp. NPDC046570]|uniref:MFS transporter n=1 Tax=Nonomuraea sp. NPDC046570 TaxID=3155255 RepID=UPI0033F60E53
MPIDDTTRAVQSTSRSTEVRKVVLSSYLGSLLEYYDFLLYGTASALVFGPVFFSGMSSAAGTVAAFGTFAAGYLARPLGGVLFGHLGDRVGRKSMLVLSLVLMGTASILIGLVPSSTSIGSWAPVLLVFLRVVQGIALGGEWGGAVLMSLEHAEGKSRGFIGAFTYIGAPSGALLGTLAMAVVSQLPEADFLQWGWRIPFLLSAVMLAIGLYVRSSVSESPVFLAAAERAAAEAKEGRRSAPPVLEVLGRWRVVLSVGLAGFAGFAVQTMFATFAITYAVGNGGDRSTILAAHSLSYVFAIVFGLVFARLSDSVGRRPVMIGGLVGIMVLTFPLFALLERGTFMSALVAFSLFVICTAANHGTLPAYITERFGTRTRYTGSSLGYQLATLLGGGLTPLVLASLFASSGGSIIPIGVFVIGLCLVSVVAIALSGESKDNDLVTV